jgi:hypothetical protein
MELVPLARRVGKMFLRFLIYVGVGGLLVGPALGSVIGYFAGVSDAARGDLAIRFVGLGTQAAVYVWIVGEIVRAVKRKKTPST